MFGLKPCDLIAGSSQGDFDKARDKAYDKDSLTG